MTLALQVAAYALVPALAKVACERVKVLKALGPVVVCYAVGILAANLPFVTVAPGPAMSVNEASVALAIPLLLFSTELKKWLSLGPGLLIAFGLACASAIAAATLAGFTFRASTDEWWKVAGMLVGVYVGGTPNMNAIGIALETKSETFVLLNAADVVVGGAWLFVMLTVGQRVLLRFMKPFPASSSGEAHVAAEAPKLWSVKTLPSTTTALALALACVVASAGVAFGAAGKLDGTVVMLSLTTLALALSLVEKVRSLATASVLGEYLLLVFCVSVGSLADVSKLSGASVPLLLFVVMVVGLSVVLHVSLCKAFGIDVDTTLVSSTAAVFGPAFIPPVAAALKNKALLAPGITLGLAGLALGTYLGLFTAWALRSLGG